MLDSIYQHFLVQGLEAGPVLEVWVKGASRVPRTEGDYVVEYGMALDTEFDPALWCALEKRV